VANLLENFLRLSNMKVMYPIRLVTQSRKWNRSWASKIRFEAWKISYIFDKHFIVISTSTTRSSGFSATILYEFLPSPRVLTCFVKLKLPHLTFLVDFDCSTLKMEALWFSETRGTNHLGTRRHIPQDLTLLLTAFLIKTKAQNIPRMYLSKHRGL